MKSGGTYRAGRGLAGGALSGAGRGAVECDRAVAKGPRCGIRGRSSRGGVGGVFRGTVARAACGGSGRRAECGGGTHQREQSAASGCRCRPPNDEIAKLTEVLNRSFDRLADIVRGGQQVLGGRVAPTENSGDDSARGTGPSFAGDGLERGAGEGGFAAEAADEAADLVDRGSVIAGPGGCRAGCFWSVSRWI